MPDAKPTGLTGFLSRLTAAASRRLAWTLPWIFIALRRAWIPTVAALIVAALFFAVPQTREVLHGLNEPALKSLADYDPRAQAVNAPALVFYVLMAGVLGCALWYAARLLCTVDADQGTPAALAARPPLDGLRRARTWYPRALGVSVVAAAVGALVYASYTPHLSEWVALALALLAVAAPVAVAVAYLRWRRHARAAQVRWIGLGGGLAALLAAALLVSQHAKWPAWLAALAASWMPALLLVALARRRVLMRHWPWLRRRLHARPGTAATDWDFDNALVTIVVLTLLSALVLATLTGPWPSWLRRFGSAAAVLLFMAAATLLLTGLQLLLRRVGRNVPGFTSAFVAIVVTLVVAIGNEDLGEEKLPPRPRSSLMAPPAPPPADTGDVPRTLYVNAYGGGLRAAVFTAQVLAAADDLTCGRFGERVAAFSGVSGGSVGLAAYLVARQEWVSAGGPQRCLEGRQDPQKPPLTEVVTHALVQDHLSPVLARMLAIDLPHLPGAPLRGQALLSSLDDALTQALALQFGRKPSEFTGLALPLGRLTGGFARPPAVYFNATDADSGHILWFSNRAGGSALTRGWQRGNLDMSVGAAVLHSARFPVVSPAGRFRPKALPGGQGTQPAAADVAPMRVVDGGYADNSGATTLLDFMSQHPLSDPAAGQLVNIDGNPDESGDGCTDELAADAQGGILGRLKALLGRDGQDANPPPMLTALRALLQARSAHATKAVERLVAYGKVEEIRVSFRLEQALPLLELQARAAPATAAGQTARPQTPQEQKRELCADVKRAEKAPLGWYMTYEAARVLGAAAAAGVGEMCRHMKGQLACAAPG